MVWWLGFAQPFSCPTTLQCSVEVVLWLCCVGVGVCDNYNVCMNLIIMIILQDGVKIQSVTMQGR